MNPWLSVQYVPSWPVPWIAHAARVAVVAAIAWLVHAEHVRYVGRQATADLAGLPVVRVQKHLPEAAAIGGLSAPVAGGRDLLDAAGERVGTMLRTSPAGDAAIDARKGGRYRLALRTFGQAGDEVLAVAAEDAIKRKLRLFGLFGVAEGNLPYQTADGDFDPVGCRPEQQASADRLRKKYCPLKPYTEADLTENPTLADMTRAALDVLHSRGNFWLMVEAGDVDWASHANDIDSAIGAVKSGDAAFQAVVKWIERHDAWNDSVVIVTADHGHLFVLDDPTAFARR